MLLSMFQLIVLLVLHYPAYYLAGHHVKIVAESLVGNLQRRCVAPVCKNSQFCGRTRGSASTPDGTRISFRGSWTTQFPFSLKQW